MLGLGAAALALPNVLVRVDATPATFNAGLTLFDSRYPHSSTIAASIGRRRERLDLNGADPVRLWRIRLLPLLNAGASISGCCTYSTWHILQYSAFEARHRPRPLPQPAFGGSAVTLVAWQLLPKRPG
jgi:hypothetical protein